MSALPFDTLICDLDGTLIDSAVDVMVAVNRTLADHGLPPIPVDQGATLMGEGGRVRMQKAFARHGRDLDDRALSAVVKEFVAHYGKAPVERTRPYDGVPETLRALAAQGVVIGVCTNKYETSAREILGILSLTPPVSDVAGADSFDVRKPHPGHILKLLERMGRDPARTAMIGDSVHDVHAARAANIPVVAVSWGYADRPAAELGADAVIDRFSDLPATLAALRR